MPLRLGWGLSNVLKPLSPAGESKLLLVEGRDEELVLGAFLRHLAIADVPVQGYGGKDRLKQFLEALLEEVAFAQIQSIGIVRDADDNARSALQSVQSSLRNVGLPAPQNFLEPAGDLPDSPRVAVFIMPDNANPGALENLCLTALADDPAMGCVEAFMQCVQAAVATPPADAAKARMHAFLASREDPELRLGEAGQRRYLPWDNPAFGDLAQFLRTI